MINKKPNKLISFTKEHWKLILAICLAPVILGVFMMLPFSNIDNGSNDGWLGFWGGYLGAIISIGGVYQSIKATKANDLSQEIRSKRPALSSLGQNGIQVGTKIYHSTVSVPYEQTYGRFLSVENVTDKPLLYGMCTIYNFKGEPVDMVWLPSLVNERVLLSFRNSSKEQLSKLKIVFKTTGNEYGLFTRLYNDGEAYVIPETIYGPEAEKEYEATLQRFEVHNKSARKGSSETYHLNSSTFSESELEAYEKGFRILAKERVREKYGEDTANQMFPEKKSNQ